MKYEKSSLMSWEGEVRLYRKEVGSKDCQKLLFRLLAAYKIDWQIWYEKGQLRREYRVSQLKAITVVNNVKGSFKVLYLSWITNKMVSYEAENPH